MDGRNRLLALLAEKRERMLECEQATENLCACPAEELEGQVAKRQRALDRIASLDLEIRALAVGDGAARAALNHTCGRGELPDELAELYDASLAVKTVASRILRVEETVRLRLESERLRALEQLQKMNSSASVVAGRYHRSVQTGVTRPPVPGREKKV